MNWKLVTSAALALCFAGMLLLAGCDTGTAGKSESETKVPKLSFHKPRNFRLAVERLRELHSLLSGDEPMPAPISYTVEEVNHAHVGGHAHVHYKLVEASMDDEAMSDQEEDEHKNVEVIDSKTVAHKIEVDAFTEMADIAKWLPAIVSDSDMPADQWKSVKAVSEQLGSQLESFSSADQVETQRKEFQQRSGSFDEAIKELEKIVKPSAASLL